MRTLNITPLLALLCLLGLNEPSCAVCDRRKPNAPKAVGCGPLVGDQDKCLFYEHFRTAKKTVCGHCLEGSALDLKTHTCVPGKIQGCNAELIYLGGIRSCFSCKDGYAKVSTDGTAKCVPTSQVENPIAHCLWGSTYQKTANFSTINCYRCQAGYTVSFDSQKCEKTKYTGCLRNSPDGSRCQECDVFAGFSQQPDYSCLKVGDDGVPLETQKFVKST